MQDIHYGSVVVRSHVDRRLEQRVLMEVPLSLAIAMSNLMGSLRRLHRGEDKWPPKGHIGQGLGKHEIKWIAKTLSETLDDAIAFVDAHIKTS